MIISQIAAMSKNRIIGNNNQLPWSLPADMTFFKNKTVGHTVIMGKNNYLAEGKPLRDRKNIIVTHNREFKEDGIWIAYSVEEALDIGRKIETEELFIIGGGQIYEQTLKYTQRIYLTVIDAFIEGDVFYPEIDCNNWILLNSRFYMSDKQNPFSHTYYVYNRKC